MYDPTYPLDKLQPASYNPRRIDEQALSLLQESLNTFGLVKPVIVTRKNILVAGHQRTRAMKALGWTHCPAFLLPPVNTADEVRFNQLHNASDLDAGAEQVRIPAGLSPGFHWVKAKDIQADTLRVPHAMKKTEILRLLAKYGDWGSCVATEHGIVLVSGLYAMCCQIVNRPCLTYVLPHEKAPLVSRYFGREYGVFSYDHLPKTTWAQSLAQMMRIRREGATTKRGTPKGSSRTYENLVLPRLSPGLSVLDFGAGQMDYVHFLQQRGVDILGIEFYFRKGRQIDVPQVHRDIDRLCRRLSEQGRFDMVVCDSVLNSVDSLQAEADVLTCLNAFCKPGGTVIFSGRSRNSVERKATVNTINTDPDSRYVHFLDGNGFSAMYGQGVWRYQKFHTLPEIQRLTECFLGSQYAIFDDEGKPAKETLRRSAWGVVVTKENFLPEERIEAALGREFDLPLPGGKSYGRSADILTAWRTGKERGGK